MGEHFADGKPLTDRGNIKLDDALALAELLGTDESAIDKIGDQTSQTILDPLCPGGPLAVVGSSVIIARLEQGGLPVTTVPSAEDLEAVELVELTTDVTFAPDSWWALTTRWLALQSDPTALAAVLERIAEQDMAILAYLLEAPPESAREPLLAALRPLVAGTEADPTDLRAIAMGRLVQIGELDLSSLDKGAALEAMIAALAVMARSSPEAIPAALAQERGRGEQLEMIREMGGQMPAGVVHVLEAVGGTHPDKVVAKAARKELFRVRSRQVNAAGRVIRPPGRTRPQRLRAPSRKVLRRCPRSPRGRAR